MSKNKRSVFAKFRILLALPIVAALLATFSLTVRPVEASAKTMSKSQKLKFKEKAENEMIQPIKYEDLRKSIDSVSSKTDTVIVKDSSYSEDAPYLFRDEIPKFMGGDASQFSAWVAARIKYPVEAMKKGIQGTVIVSFVIKKDGTLSDVKILRTPHPLLSQEVIRVVEMSPKWSPGRAGGNPVNSIVEIPVVFELN